MLVLRHFHLQDLRREIASAEITVTYVDLAPFSLSLSPLRNRLPGGPCSGPSARYEYWPSKQATMPLLFFCAEEVLAGDLAATTFNERLHTPAQRSAVSFALN